MKTNNTHKLYFILLLLCFIVCFVINLSLGSADIPLDEVVYSFFNASTNKTWQYIVLDYRLPKAITIIGVGAGLGVSGLLMQTLFKNPLAGPYVLGISSGASLGVAFLVMGSSLLGGLLSGVLLSKWSLVIAASSGSLIALLAVITASRKIKDTMAILIIGFMFSSITSSLVSVLSYFSTSEQLQQFVFWGYGNLGNVSWTELKVITVIIGLGIFMSFLLIKPLNALLLGNQYAKSLGVNIKMSRLLIIISTSLLSGVITAFVGPIAFIGLAIPHISRQLFNTTNHYVLLPAVVLCGTIIMLICDTIAQLPFSNYTLPINAITSLIGAPVIIWQLVRMRKIVF